jgi:hypothetical protein
MTPRVIRQDGENLGTEIVGLAVLVIGTVLRVVETDHTLYILDAS